MKKSLRQRAGTKVAALLVTAALSLTACGSGGTGAGAEGDGPVTLRFTW